MRAILLLLLVAGIVAADGKVVRPREYKGSLEEYSQEAIIIFEAGDDEHEALEHLILKVGVQGRADHFAWVIPFPKEPKIEKEDTILFEELFRYVEQRRIDQMPKPKSSLFGGEKDGGKKPERSPVEVLARETVGSYDVAKVREHEAGALNRWLKEEGFQPLPADSEEVLAHYREKNYVFVCIKVADTQLSTRNSVALHPLRFTFHTGGRDGIYFPMKMTGLQEQPFDVNLYVFFRFWLNDHKSKYGYEQRGFRLKYRDWDSRVCKANAGKNYAEPREDPFLNRFRNDLKNVAALFRKLAPDGRFYLTNIYTRGLRPAEVRGWSTDLWLFPYYTNPGRVPYDVQEGGPAEGEWPDLPFNLGRWFLAWGWIVLVVLASVVVLFYCRQRFAASVHGHVG